MQTCCKRERLNCFQWSSLKSPSSFAFPGDGSENVKEDKDMRNLEELSMGLAGCKRQETNQIRSPTFLLGDESCP